MDSFIYALGFFDGVHLGHQALLRRCLELCAKSGCRPGVVTFSNHPDTFVLGSTPGLINTPHDRERMLKAFGMERVVTLPFNEKLRDTAWQDFLRDLRRDYNAAGFVCGDDFRFGAKGQGNADLLMDYCRREGLPGAAVPEQSVAGTRVSSTHIRSLLEAGRVDECAEFLGHPHMLSGTVVSGRHLGRTLGIPTANLAFPMELAVPRFGVYACRVLIGSQSCRAVTNIGTRPTVAGHGITVESWILDYEGDLYGRDITLEFHAFLRPEQKFESLQAMQQEIFRNAETVREILT